jgi:hypothetical protein
MGQLQSLRRCSGGGGGGLPADVDLVSGLHQQQPSAAADPREQELQAALAALLEESRACLAGVRGYQDQSAVLRAAMGSPQDDALQVQAFVSLLPNVGIVKAAYDLGQRLGEVLPALFMFLAGRPLREHQLLLRQLADLLDVALLWDYSKMQQPALQNDFSYYRRYYGKVAPRLSGNAGLPVNEAEAGMVSMFIAQPLPLTVAVEGAIKGLGGGSGAGGAAAAAPAAGAGGDLGAFCAAVDTVGTLANVACDLALRPALPDDETRRYALRVMTAAVVLYDRVSAAGVFIRRSPVRTRKCLRTLRRAQQQQLGPADGGASSSLAQQLLNSVKYSTVHYKDGSTPGYIRTLLSD